MFVLEGGSYAESAQSAVLVPLTDEVLSCLIAQSKSLDVAAWLDLVATRARKNAGPPG